MDQHAAAGGADQVLDHDRILIALVLQEEGMFGVVDELTHPLAPVADAPDQVRVVAGRKVGPMPIGLKTLDDLVDFVLMGGNDGIVAGYRQVLGLPVQRLYIGGRIVDHHRLLVGEVELGIAVEDLDSGLGQDFAGLLVLLLAAAPGGIEHDAHLERYGDGRR